MELAVQPSDFSPVVLADDRAYLAVRRAIAFISVEWQEQPSLAQIAKGVGLSPTALHRRFTEIAGLTPKAFLQAVTLNHSRKLLDEEGSVLEASNAAGLSGPSRLHDLFVAHEAMPPGIYKTRGAGLRMDWGFHPTPFGTALIVAQARRVAGVGFADNGDEEAAIDDFRRRWPRAEFRYATEKTAAFAERIFDPAKWRAGRPIRLAMIGSDFEIRVWEALLKVPFGGVTSYAALAKSIGRPKAARAVGAAVGRNPISFVVPCHRVLGKGGSLTGYHWGLTRKRALLGWETGLMIGEDD
jgi:AraC family transcriptional regulator of adaptative response/methylated-DNA-[protein]-cysteine methyltransferase